MRGTCRRLALAAAGLALACGGDPPELGREADIEVDSAGGTGLAPSGAVEEVVGELRGEPGRTIYLAPPDLAEPDPRALFPGPGREAVLAAPPPPAEAPATRSDSVPAGRPPGAPDDTATAPPEAGG